MAKQSRRTRPQPIPLAALEVPHEPVLGGALELRLHLSLDWVPVLVDAVDAVVQAFVRAGGLGGYCHGGQAAASQLWLDGSATAEGAVLSYRLCAQGLDRLAFQYLRHMLAKPALGAAHLTRLVVHIPSAVPLQGQTLEPVDDANEGELYPAPHRSFSFPVEWVDDTGGGKSRRVLLEFPEEVQRQDVERLRAPVAAWNALLESGAFALPFGHPAVVDNVAGSIGLHDAYTVEIGVAVYRGSEVGFDCLLNLLDACCAKGVALQSVAIE